MAHRFLVLMLVALAVSGCARRAIVVAEQSPEDTLKSCEEIEGELRELEAQLFDTDMERTSSIRNDRAFAFAPLTFGQSLAYVDTLPTREIEREALITRHHELGTVALRQRCFVNGAETRFRHYAGNEPLLRDRNITPIPPVVRD